MQKELYILNWKLDTFSLQKYIFITKVSILTDFECTCNVHKMNVHVKHYSYAAKWVSIKLRTKWNLNKKFKQSKSII